MLFRSAACVAPPGEFLHWKGAGKTPIKIISVVNELDPFRTLSLGHVAQLTIALSMLCEDPDLRSTILMRTDGRMKDIDDRDLKWCFETLEEMRGSMNQPEKLYPPGRIIFLSQRQGVQKKHPLGTRGVQNCSAHVVTPDFFSDLTVGPRMFDLSQHVPELYRRHLTDCLATMSKEYGTSDLQ